MFGIYPTVKLSLFELAMSVYLFITVLSVLATVALTASSSEVVRHVDAKSPTGEFVLIFLTCHYHGNL